MIKIDENIQNQAVQQVKGISQLISEINNHSTNTEWEKLTTKMKSLGFDESNENRKKKIEQCLFRHNFISKVFPVLRDLTRSLREGDWKLHLSAIQKALPLVFAFDGTSYKRWLPLYFEDSLSFPKKYPSIHESFLQGEFVVRLTQRNVSAVPMDQALESKYDKPARGASGIIGITRRKAAVSKWNLIKHEKSNYTNLLRQMLGINNEDEYSLHHEFTKQRTEKDLQCVKQLAAYVNKRGNPFNGREILIKNLVTGVTFNEKSSSFILNCFSERKVAYEKFRKERLDIKLTKLFDIVPKSRLSFKKGKRWKKKRRNGKFSANVRLFEATRV